MFDRMFFGNWYPVEKKQSLGRIKKYSRKLSGFFGKFRIIVG